RAAHHVLKLAGIGRRFQERKGPGRTHRRVACLACNLSHPQRSGLKTGDRCGPTPVKEVHYEPTRQAHLAALVAHPQQRGAGRRGDRRHRGFDRDTGPGKLGRRVLCRRALRVLWARLRVLSVLGLSRLRLLPLLLRRLLRRLLPVLLRLRPVAKFLVQPPIGWSLTLSPAPAGLFLFLPALALTLRGCNSKEPPRRGGSRLAKEGDDKSAELPLTRVVAENLARSR